MFARVFHITVEEVLLVHTQMKWNVNFPKSSAFASSVYGLFSEKLWLSLRCFFGKCDSTLLYLYSPMDFIFLCSSLDDVSSLTSWDELSMNFFCVFGRPGTPGKVPHCWKFLFVGNGLHHGSVESQSLRNGW